MSALKKVCLFILVLFSVETVSAQLPVQFSYTVSQSGVSPETAISKAFSSHIDPEYLQTSKETLWLRFSIQPSVFNGKSLFLKSSPYDKITLYGVDGSKITEIGTAGDIVPLNNPKVKRELYTVEIPQQTLRSTANFLVGFEIIHHPKKIVFPQVYTDADFQNLIFKRNSSGYESVWKPIYFGILIFFMGITSLYFFFSREKMFLFYFLYLLFISLRSALAGSLLVPEQYFPFLQHINFSGRHFQTVTFLSFIFYYKFIEEISDAKNRPIVFKKFLKIQYVYLIVMIVFDMAFVVEKYSQPTLYTIFKSLELLGLVLGFICIGFLVKYYNPTIKYILIGIISFFTIALFGQEMIIFFSEKSRMEQRAELSIVWSIAYLIELSFFAVAIVKRAVDSQKQNVTQQSENDRLRTLLKNQSAPTIAFSDTIAIPTLNEKLVFKQTDIVRLEAAGSYSIFHVSGHLPVMASYNLSEFEPKLNPEYFIRVHKSHIVNVQYIEKYAKKDNSFLTLTTGDSIPVSRTKKKFIEMQLSR